MKRSLLTVISLAALISVQAQSSPKEPISAPPSASVVKHDTLVKSMIFLETHDTIPVYLIYAGPNHTLMYEEGFYLRTGLKKDGAGEFVKLNSVTLMGANFQKPKYKVIDTKQR